mmetsp:Transcript_33608/g.108039  ORF Transcript_33608/g.108039 Transcript_33608/m.108039 type:complete len:214 (-) Transcript_33608:65-706(-)
MAPSPLAECTRLAMAMSAPSSGAVEVSNGEKCCGTRLGTRSTRTRAPVEDTSTSCNKKSRNARPAVSSRAQARATAPIGGDSGGDTSSSSLAARCGSGEGRRGTGVRTSAEGCVHWSAPPEPSSLRHARKMQPCSSRQRTPGSSRGSRPETSACQRPCVLRCISSSNGRGSESSSPHCREPLVVRSETSTDAEDVASTSRPSEETWQGPAEVM